MTNQHPITPPPELIKQWVSAFYDTSIVAPGEFSIDIATKAAQWGSDLELDACCEVLARELICDGKHVATDLRAARRPKPPSLKEQALAALRQVGNCEEIAIYTVDTIRRALEALDD